MNVNTSSPRPRVEMNEGMPDPWVLIKFFYVGRLIPAKRVWFSQMQCVIVWRKSGSHCVKYFSLSLLYRNVEETCALCIAFLLKCEILESLSNALIWTGYSSAGMMAHVNDSINSPYVCDNDFMKHSNKKSNQDVKQSEKLIWISIRPKWE